MIAYAGSFVLMEEYSEKTEKTEKSEEALYSLYHSKQFGKTLKKGKSTLLAGKFRQQKDAQRSQSPYFLPSDFNIHFIYHTSYLDTEKTPS